MSSFICPTQATKRSRSRGQRGSGTRCTATRSPVSRPGPSNTVSLPSAPRVSTSTPTSWRTSPSASLRTWRARPPSMTGGYSQESISARWLTAQDPICPGARGAWIRLSRGRTALLSRRHVALLLVLGRAHRRPAPRRRVARRLPGRRLQGDRAQLVGIRTAARRGEGRVRGACGALRPRADPLAGSLAHERPDGGPCDGLRRPPAAAEALRAGRHAPGLSRGRRAGRRRDGAGGGPAGRIGPRGAGRGPV